MYTASREDDAEKIKQQLIELGYNVNALKMSHLAHSQFIANKNAVSIDFYHWLQKKIPDLDKMQFIYDPTENYSVGSDFTIVLTEGK